MASAVAQQLFSSTRKIYFLSTAFTTIVRNSSCSHKPRPRRGTVKFRNLIASDCQSLADRGFLRSQKPFNPPADASEKINAIAETFFGAEFTITDSIPSTSKFHFLEECWKVFDYSIPNSQLHKMNTIHDVLQFYTTPIKTTTPFDELKQIPLPPNLHVQYDYVRFDPEIDVKFDGVSAFPESPTIVTSLRGRKKYKGVMTKLPSHYHNEAYHKKTGE